MHENCWILVSQDGRQKRLSTRRTAAGVFSVGPGSRLRADLMRSAKVVKKLSQETAARLSPSFPGPLLLPKDELNWDPEYPPQSFRSWLIETQRNKPTPERKALYVAASPIITSGVSFMNDWIQPATALTGELRGCKPPSADASLEYLSAFYHGLPVKFLPEPLCFVPWVESSKRTGLGSSHDYVGLAHNGFSTRIRTRETPDKKFKRQLQLNDLLDATISMLPEDAYSIVLLIDLDMYEDDDDDFCCGRAYGGSRVCVVSSARYHPSLDADANIDHEHMWPASHCKRFADGLCAVEELEPQVYKKSRFDTPDSPLRQAVGAARGSNGLTSADDWGGLWFSRVARTLVHEIGHCFGMDHCVYYACNMQGTSGMVEDVRQPPYLCPVCLEKVAHAIACELQMRDQIGKDEYIKERYRAIATFCESWKSIELFAGYGAWIRARLQLLSV
ncbi:hypothetical protein ONZ43_g1451 [Nemania bipapillata]|uniref:Uncharacterized protein n=1 Tax=Nemania bipapillata TaxID=110536 RepID=A0ACC2J4R8_9PEZI|nr:hypothetical protein ONZ43_g1451 [Nemania bipapillata]